MKNVKDGKIIGKVDSIEYITQYGYPEVGVFTEKRDLQKFYKQLDTDIIMNWCADKGLEFNPCEDNDSIHRMRACMSILYLHFPRQSKSKKKAKYAQYSQEDLANMAVQNKIAVEETTDDRILRMRLIMNLRANGVIE